MKKPEPWPVTTSLPFGVFGAPKRRKKRSNGEPGGNGRSSSLRPEFAGRSTLTRTEITAGLTFSTISANPTGRCDSCCTLSVRFCACAAAPNRSAFGATFGTTNATALKPAIVVASSAARRTASIERDHKQLLCIRYLQHRDPYLQHRDPSGDRHGREGRRLERRMRPVALPVAVGQI